MSRWKSTKSLGLSPISSFCKVQVSQAGDDCHSRCIAPMRSSLISLSGIDDRPALHLPVKRHARHTHIRSGQADVPTAPTQRSQQQRTFIAGGCRRRRLGGWLHRQAPGSGFGPAGIGLLILLSALLEGRYRGHSTPGTLGPGWEPTAERFRDDESGQWLRVWFHSASGERRYQPDDAPPP